MIILSRLPRKLRNSRWKTENFFVNVEAHSADHSFVISSRCVVLYSRRRESTLHCARSTKIAVSVCLRRRSRAVVCDKEGLPFLFTEESLFSKNEPYQKAFLALVYLLGSFSLECLPFSVYCAAVPFLPFYSRRVRRGIFCNAKSSKASWTPMARSYRVGRIGERARLFVFSHFCSMRRRWC